MIKALSISYRLISILAGIGLLAGALIFLSVENIALFYIIQSIVAVQMLVEMGISNTAIQFLQTEMLSLRKIRCVIRGEKGARKRFFGLYYSLAKYFFIASIFYIFGSLIYAILIIPYGNDGYYIEALLPFILIILAVAVKLNLNFYELLIEGAGEYKKVLLVRFLAILVAFGTALVFLYKFHNLFYMAIFYIINTFFCVIVYMSINKKFNRQLTLNYLKFEKGELLQQVIALQSKSLINWVAGYIYYFLITVIIYKISIPLFSSQVGTSFAILMYIVLIGNSYLYVHNMKVLDYYNTDKIKYKSYFKKIKSEVFLLQIIITFGIFIALFIVRVFSIKISSIPDIKNIVLIIFNSFFMQYYNIMGFYIRVQKAEPFYKLFFAHSLISILAGIITFYFAGITAMLITYLIVSIAMYKFYKVRFEAMF